MVKCFPQTQLAGRSGGRHPYLRHRASLNAPLHRAKLCSAIGRAESQLEVPFSFETSNVLCIQVGSVLDSSVARFFSCSLIRLQATDFDFFCDPLQLVG